MLGQLGGNTAWLRSTVWSAGTHHVLHDGVIAGIVFGAQRSRTPPSAAVGIEALRVHDPPPPTAVVEIHVHGNSPTGSRLLLAGEEFTEELLLDAALVLLSGAGEMLLGFLLLTG